MTRLGMGKFFGTISLRSQLNAKISLSFKRDFENDHSKLRILVDSRLENQKIWRFVLTSTIDHRPKISVNYRSIVYDYGNQFHGSLVYDLLLPAFYRPHTKKPMGYGLWFEPARLCEKVAFERTFECTYFRIFQLSHRFGLISVICANHRS